jgi:hypothetical protein
MLCTQAVKTFRCLDLTHIETTGVMPISPSPRWQFQLAPDLRTPPPTLRDSYLAQDRWIFEVETMLRDGVARLQHDRADRIAAILVSESLRRLIAERAQEKRLADSSAGRIGRYLKRFRSRTERDRHIDDLYQLAVGVLMHHGWSDYVGEARELAADERFEPAAIVGTAVDANAIDSASLLRR